MVCIKPGKFSCNPFLLGGANNSRKNHYTATSINLKQKYAYTLLYLEDNGIPAKNASKYAITKHRHKKNKYGKI